MLQYISDLHLEKGFKRIITARKPYLLLAGDIGYPKESIYKDFILNLSSSFDKIFIIAGNHEYDNVIPKEFDKIDNQIENICSMRQNLFYLQKKEYLLCDKTKTYLAGCTLWSKFPKTKTHVHNEHVKWLRNTLKQNKEKNYIIGTHHCPHYNCINRKYAKRTLEYFGSDQTELIKMNNVQTWIYGHNHMNKDIKIYDKWLLTNQYGSYENPLFNFKN